MKPARRHLLVALVLVAVGAGCGSEAETTKPGASAGTPRQAVLAWWGQVRANDPERARELYLDPPPLPDLAGQFNFLGDRLEGELKVLSSEPKRETTLVVARWSPPDDEPRRVALRLRERGGEWKLTDAPFLDEMVAELQQEE